MTIQIGRPSMTIQIGRWMWTVYGRNRLVRRTKSGRGRTRLDSNKNLTIITVVYLQRITLSFWKQFPNEIDWRMYPYLPWTSLFVTFLNYKRKAFWPFEQKAKSRYIIMNIYILYIIFTNVIIAGLGCLTIQNEVKDFNEQRRMVMGAGDR